MQTNYCSRHLFNAAPRQTLQEAEQEVAAALSTAAEREAELVDAAAIAELLAEELGRQHDAATATTDDLTLKV